MLVSYKPLPTTQRKEARRNFKEDHLNRISHAYTSKIDRSKISLLCVCACVFFKCTTKRNNKKPKQVFFSTFPFKLLRIRSALSHQQINDLLNNARVQRHKYWRERKENETNNETNYLKEVEDVEKNRRYSFKKRREKHIYWIRKSVNVGQHHIISDTNKTEIIKMKIKCAFIACIGSQAHRHWTFKCQKAIKKICIKSSSTNA